MTLTSGSHIYLCTHLISQLFVSIFSSWASKVFIKSNINLEVFSHIKAYGRKVDLAIK